MSRKLLDTVQNHPLLACSAALGAPMHTSIATPITTPLEVTPRGKDGEEVEYPSYGVTGPAKAPSPAGDRKLAQSAQMYHYQVTTRLKMHRTCIIW